MSDWVHSRSVGWMAVLVFGGTYLLALAIYWIVTRLATGEHARALMTDDYAAATGFSARYE